MLLKEKDEVHVAWNPKEEKVNGGVPQPDSNAAFFCLAYAEDIYILRTSHNYYKSLRITTISSSIKITENR